ncbi:hypothetical protein ACT29H_07340 [Thermophagus sp. OGC60D27]|uniref:hypothetical protein n=1 Tax=Thermophagus sp. OGC60D27 TaxID=3458415 RepID=UPI004037A828
MNDLIATIYEVWFGLYDPQFTLIFDTLYDTGGYLLLASIFIFIPMLMFLGFYFLWKYPYGKWWHWLIWLIVTVIITGLATWGIANNQIFLSGNQQLMDALANPESNFEEYAKSLTIKYALVNSLLSIFISFLTSFLSKQGSKIQTHLPF